MTDQTTTAAGPGAGLGTPARPGQAPSPRDLAARASGRDAASGASPRRLDAEPPAGQPVQMTGAQALVAALERLGVDVVFGIPGGAILPAYDPLFDSAIVRHILVRHEQGAGHAATGYAQATGRSASAWPPRARARPTWSPRSPTPTWTRCRSSPSPARSPSSLDRHRRLPGSRHRRASRCRSPSTTSWSPTPDDIPRTIAEAFHIAATGRPGPVLVDIAKDALQAQTHVPLAGADRPARATARSPRPHAQADPRGRPADRRRATPPGAVRRRRGAQGASDRRAASRWPS